MEGGGQQRGQGSRDGRWEAGDGTVAENLDPDAIDAPAVWGVRVRVADAEHGCAGAEAVEVQEVVLRLLLCVLRGGGECRCGRALRVGGFAVESGVDVVRQERLRGFGGEEGRAQEGAVGG